ncbi:unnamed protein product [Rhizoctonia solani]|uniref:Uncharacterized protein n=1 Tax=Rhizoctonia solani TaxID=456999 RepID=A0A8H2X235_9AGAM|nr:unnamed protein product [Rhizoctonia solani]CAE6416019.1 unnamed protein product [Rhizoctonia solani]
MNKNMDNLFVRTGRPLRLHFDDSRITAAAIRQLGWRVEQGGGVIVGQPSVADVLVVDPAAPWVFHDFLKTKRLELRPSVVLAFWIPLCLTTRTLIWTNHSYWQQVVIPSERLPRSEIPQGITAYSSFLAGISYSKNTMLSTTKTVPRSLAALDRDSSVISNLDNSDLEVSRSLEPGASSDDEPLEIPRKPKESVSGKAMPRSHSPSTSTLPQRPTEMQKDEDEVEGILPASQVSLPPNDVDMASPSLPPEPVQKSQEESVVENVAPPNPSASAGSAEKQPSAVLGSSSSQRHRSPRHSSPQNEQNLPSHAEPSPATAAVEPTFSSGSNTQATIETGPSAAPQHTATPPAASETVTETKEAYVPPTLDSSPSPTQEEPNSTPPDSSPKIPDIITHEPLTGTTAISDKLRSLPPASPSISIVSSVAKSESVIVLDSSNTPNKIQTTQGEASIETNVTRKPAEIDGSAITPAETASPGPIKPRAPTSTAPPNTPAVALKTSAPVSSTGLKRALDTSSGSQSSRPSPSNATKVRVRPRMRPPPDGNDSIASGSVLKASLVPMKSKLKILSGANGGGTKPRSSAVASTTGGAPPIKPGHSSAHTTTAPGDSPASTMSPSVTHNTTSLPASANTTPATTVAADTPNPAPGSSLSRPKQLIVRSPTVSPIQSRHLARSSTSYPSSPEVVPLFGPPTPPTPTPEQLVSLAAKRSAWTKEEDQYIIDYMNWVFAQDPLASTSEIMKEIAAHCTYRTVGNWQNRFTSKEDSIYMNEVPVLFERLTNKTSGGSSSRNTSKALEILSGSRTRNRSTVDYVDSSEDENRAGDDGDGPPRKKIRRSRASGRRRSDRLG